MEKMFEQRLLNSLSFELVQEDGAGSIGQRRRRLWAHGKARFCERGKDHRGTRLGDHGTRMDYNEKPLIRPLHILMPTINFAGTNLTAASSCGFNGSLQHMPQTSLLVYDIARSFWGAR